MLQLHIRRKYVQTLLAYFIALILVCAATHHSNSVLYKDPVKVSHNSVSKGKSTVKAYSRLWKYLFKSEKPWLLLPNNGMCYQERCGTNKDCCRKYNICDRSAGVCIDCWYGYPCFTAGDCCERYPHCSKSKGATTGRCHRD